MSKSICILINKVSSGGAERVAANLSISLYNQGYDVTLFSMQGGIDYSFKGTIFDFGLVKAKFNRIKSFLIFKNFFKTSNFDVIIDHRSRSNFFKEFVFSKFVFYKSRVIYCVHSYDLNYYFSFLSMPGLALLPHVKHRDFVSVCDEVQLELIKKINLKSLRIYNYVIYDQILENSKYINQIIESSYIISIGRLVVSKQFDVLIKCYAGSDLRKNNIELLILGDGPEKENLERLILELDLKRYVKLIPFQKNPYGLIKNAKALILSSRVEGFPMVLIEALTLKVPVISFDCKSGPKEIVKNMANGLLVENQNQQQLTAALNKLLLNDSIYKKIKEKANQGLEKYSEEQIIQEWIKLLENQI